MEQQQRAELIHGPLNLVLRAGRLCGMAPVSFHSHGITLSKPLIFFSFLFIIVCDIVEFTGLILDIMLTGTSDGYRSPTLLNTIIWLPDLGLNMVSGTYGVLQAPYRMKCIIKYMDLLEKVKVELGIRGTEKCTDRKRRALFVVMMTILLSLALFDYAVFLQDGIDMNKDMTIVYLYFGFYAQFSMWMVLQMQYVIAALTITDLQQALNSQLENMIDSITNEGDFVYSSIATDIHRLAVVYNEINSVVRQADEAHGPGIFILFMILIMDLTVTPYYVMVAIIKGEGATIDFTLMLLWCGFFLINFAVLIEPAHRTKDQYHRTRDLISSLSCLVPVSEPLSVELGRFFEQLLLNQASYSIIGLAPVDRSLVATVFVTTSTYLVIVIQFHITQASHS